MEPAGSVTPRRPSVLASQTSEFNGLPRTAPPEPVATRAPLRESRQPTSRRSTSDGATGRPPMTTPPDDALSAIKLTDFGIAKLAESQIGAEMDLFNRDDSTLTSSKTLLGAVPYMAPECWTDWKSAGQPSDVWALGCIAFHLLDGNPPFGSGRSAL